MFLFFFFFFFRPVLASPARVPRSWALFSFFSLGDFGRGADLRPAAAGAAGRCDLGGPRRPADLRRRGPGHPGLRAPASGLGPAKFKRPRAPGPFFVLNGNPRAPREKDGGRLGPFFLWGGAEKATAAVIERVVF